MDQPRLKKPTRRELAPRELPRMLSVADVAEIFGRASRTVRSWTARGIFQPIKVGNSVFIPQQQVDALLSGSMRPQLPKKDSRKISR